MSVSLILYFLFILWHQTPPAKRLRNIEKGKGEIFVVGDMEPFITTTLQDCRPVLEVDKK